MGWSANFAPKLVAMATSLERWKKQCQIYNLQPNTYHLVNIVKIGSVDPEIIGIQMITLKQTRNWRQSLAYSPLGAVLSPPANTNCHTLLDQFYPE